jgi:hypothetical protein
MTDDIRNKISKKIDGMIEAHGWAHISVSMESNDRPNYTYTIGFQDLFDVPEILIMALSPSNASDLLHGIAGQLKKGEIRIPKEGGLVPQIIKNYDTLFVPVPHEIALNTAMAAAARQNIKPLEVMQLVWPDTKGKFPDDPDCDKKISHAQSMTGFAD